MSKRVHTIKTKIRGDARPAGDSSFVSRFGGTLKGRKARAALALAVSLWMASGGIVSAGQSTTINEDHEGNVCGNHVGDDLSNRSGDPNNNTVTMTGGNITYGEVYGALIGNGTSGQSATGNQVNVSGGTIEGNGLAGAAVFEGAGNNKVENNSVTVIGSAVIGSAVTQTDIFGAYTNNGTANNNSVTIEGGTVIVPRITGGSSNYGGDATNNTVTISGGTVNVGSIIGGSLGDFIGNYNLTGKATGNQVIINGASVKADIKGGWRMPSEYNASAAVTGNIVTLNGATVTGSVFGGYCNNYNYPGPVDPGPVDIVTGNTLNLSGANTVSGMVKNFETINIKSATWGTPALTLAGAGILANAGGGFPTVNASELTFAKPETISTGGKTDLIQAAAAINANLAKDTTTQEYELNPVTGVMINAALKGSLAFNGAKTTLTYTATENKATKLTFGDVEWKDKGALIDHGATLTNVSFNGADVDTTNINFTNIKFLTANKKMTLVSSFGDTVGTITGTKYKVGSTLEGTGKASLVGNDLIFTAETSASQEQTHNTVMGGSAGMAALSAGNDFIGAATEGLALASNAGADGVSSFAQMGGGSMRQETGSHVDTHTWNAILALGHANKKERGTMEYGAFFEYGTGNYTTHDGDERGDGSTRYTGGGVLAKWTANHGMYVEGSFRAGSVHDDARNLLRDADGNPFSYETNAPYMGFHLGVGKEIAFDDMHAVDVYGRYFYNRRNGVSFDAGGHYDLDAVTSQTIRVGARYIVKRDKWNFYGGLAYEHELDGKAAGKADGVAIRGADTSGASFRGEVGATMKPGENSPWSLDLNVSGFAGKKQGFTGGVSVAFMF